MKNLTLLVILIIGLIGCGSSTHKKSENSEINVTQNEDNISDDIQDREIEVEKIINKEVNTCSYPFCFWSAELFNHKKYFKLIEREEDYNIFVNEVNKAKLPNDMKIK